MKTYSVEWTETDVREYRSIMTAEQLAVIMSCAPEEVERKIDQGDHELENDLADAGERYGVTVDQVRESFVREIEVHDAPAPRLTYTRI